MTEEQQQSLLKWIRHSSGYIRSYRGRTLILGVPGEAIESTGFNQLIQDIVLLNAIGIRVVLCYGSRPQIEFALKQQGYQSKYSNDLRITDSKSLNVVIQTTNQLRTEIEALLSKGVQNAPTEATKIQVISGNFITAQPIGVVAGIDYQYTGQIRKIDVNGIKQQLEVGAIVLIPPLGYSPTGGILNLCAEEVAGEIAQETNADKLVYLINDSDLSTITAKFREMSISVAKQQLQTKLHPQIQHYLQLAIESCEQGVSRVHFIDQKSSGALLLELFTRDGCGLMINADTYEDTRQAKVDDVAGILALIEPLEQKGVLVRRSRQKLEMEIDHFFIMERDGLVIACVALYPFEKESMAELACLAVHPEYIGSGRGQALLEYAEKIAHQQPVRKIFVLTTQTTHWFIERGFENCPIESLPISHQSLYNFTRNSKVLIKEI